MAENPTLDPLEISPAKLLFLGDIIEERLFPFPQVSQEERETLEMILDSVEKLMEPLASQYAESDRSGELAPHYLDTLKEIGLFGLIIPEEYGGIGLSNTGYSRVVQQTSMFDASTSLTIGAHSSIGMRGLLLFGNEDQHKRYYPKLATGEMLAAFCLTEPGSGSDAASIKTTASKNEDGSWTLTGSKIWITNGGIADFYTVFAKTDGEAGKLSAFIVERGWEGVSNGPKEDKMGIRASNTTTVEFNEVRVPAENLLGEEGKGFKVAMSILNSGRTGLGGGCVGAMKRCIKLAAQYSAERKQFGRTISEFGLVQAKLAKMGVDCFAAESVVSMVASFIDRGAVDYSVEAGISKVFATEALWRTANEALQIAGGNGFMKEMPYEQVVRDSRINMIFEGTNEILRLYIALSSLKDAGQYLKDISSSLGNIFNDPIKGFGVLSGYATKKLSQYTPVGRDSLNQVPAILKDDAVIYEHYTQKFAQGVEAVLKQHGKNIIGRQFITGRLADIAIDLFVGLCVLSRVAAMVESKGEQETQHERSILRLFTQTAKRRTNQALRRIEKNDDTAKAQLADFLVSQGKYPWDTL